MADKSIYFNNSEKGAVSNEKSLSQKLHEKGKNSEKFGQQVAFGLLGDVVEDATNTFTGFKDSLLDTLTGKNERNNLNKDDFDTKEVSMANRHKDAIESILNNTFNGNLWDAGVQTLNLYNTGTKWTIAKDSDIDKDKYSFKYVYFIEEDKNNDITYSASETDLRKAKIEFLESIEDPTILGYSVKIDTESSPLFNEKFSDFIDKYSKYHKEMDMCKTYRDNFQKDIIRIFSSPETEENFRLHYKNFYIQEIKGLSKLDNKFVKYSEKDDSDLLEFIIDDDIRMYVNRIAFLYRNLSYSYHLGKNLIPENLLRFNLYIKISDMRSFTSDINNVNKSIAKNGYSRVIYEIKDCQFLFPESNLPDSIITGGVSSPTSLEYSKLSFKIKYRKVNRIFYSEMFVNENNFADLTIIGDKFYSPNTTKYNEEINSWKYSKNYTKKRQEVSNNIPVGKSLADRFDKLKNDGILKEKESDTAVSRFSKSLGNKAIKQAASVVDEGLNNVKNVVSAAGNDVKSFIDNNLNSDLKNLLIGGINQKDDLGKRHDKVKLTHLLKLLVKESIRANDDRHPDTIKEIQLVNKILHPKLDYDVKQPNEDLHPDVDYKVKEPNEDLHPDVNYQVKEPNEDLHPDVDYVVKEPNEDLHPDVGYQVKEPNEDLHPDVDYKVKEPNEDLHPDVDYKVKEPNEDLHPDVDYKVKEPNEDLHPDVNYQVKEPNEDLHPDVDYVVKEPNEDLHPDVDYQVKEPNEDLHPDVDYKVKEPNEDLHPDVDYKVKEPNEDLHPDVDYKVKEPNEDLHPDVDYKVKEPKIGLFDKYIKK